MFSLGNILKEVTLPIPFIEVHCPLPKQKMMKRCTSSNENIRKKILSDNHDNLRKLYTWFHTLAITELIFAQPLIMLFITCLNICDTKTMNSCRDRKITPSLDKKCEKYIPNHHIICKIITLVTTEIVKIVT